MIVPSLVILLVCGVFGLADGQAVPISGSGYLTKFVLYQGTSGEGRPIVEINNGDVFDQAIVGTNLTIVALTDLKAVFANPTPAQLRDLPSLRWTYNNTGYIDKYRPYTMVGDYVDFHRYAPVSYLSTPGFKKVKVTAYLTAGRKKNLTKTTVGEQILDFEIINSGSSASAELSTLYLVRTSIDKEQAKLTPITDGITYNVTTLFGYSQKDQPMLPLSLKAMFKGPVEASKITFSFLNGKKYSYEGKKDDATVEMYLAMEDLMKVGKKTVTVNAFDAENSLLVSQSYSFTLTH